MAYTKNTWVTGDIVTSAKLNHMEDGIANADIFIVGGVTMDEGGRLEGTLDKTWQEIHDAMQSKICIVVIANAVAIRQSLIESASVGLDGEYNVFIWETQFTTSTANGYPAGGGGK